MSAVAIAVGYGVGVVGLLVALRVLVHRGGGAL